MSRQVPDIFKTIRHPLNILITAEFQLICNPARLSRLHRLLRPSGLCPSGGAVLHLNNPVDASQELCALLLSAGDAGA